MPSKINKTLANLKASGKPRSGADLIALAARAGQHHDQRGAHRDKLSIMWDAMAADLRNTAALAVLA